MSEPGVKYKVTPLGCGLLLAAGLVVPPAVAALAGLCVRVFRICAWG